MSTSEGILNEYLYTTDEGNIEFSAEQQEIFSEFNDSYVLTGNIRKISSGLMLNTKITELKNGRLVASSAKLVRNIVVNEAM